MSVLCICTEIIARGSHQIHAITHQEFIHTGAQSFSNAHFGQGTGPLLFDRLGCSGREQTLLSCSHSGVGVTSYYCGHDDDAGVRCQGTQLNPILYSYICTWSFCTLLTSSNKLYQWWASSERWSKCNRGKGGDLHQQSLGHYLWYTMGLPWCSGGLQAAGIPFNWQVENAFFSMHIDINFY